MARRRGRPGSYLFTDDTTGFTTFADRVQKDYWGNWSRVPLQRNLQEISSPLGDPYPVSIFRGSQYEATTACDFELAPTYVGKTTKPFVVNSQYVQLFDLDPAIPDMSVGCTFVIR